MNPIAIRLLNQQLCSPQMNEASDVVSHMGAIQAQDYRMMRWAVEMRTKKPSEAAFTEAYNSGKIIRLHLLRGTWQLVSGDDYWWMHELCSPKAETVIQSWMKSNKLSIPDEELNLVRNIFIRTAADKGSVTKEDFAEALAAKDIVMTNQRLSYHIRFSELNGTLCSGNLLPMKATYALAEDKVRNKETIDRDEALMRLTRKYFQSHSPATFDDYLWWSGLNVSDCKRGITLLGKELYMEKWHGYEFYIHESCRTRRFRKDNILLLPPFDEYIIGYKSREISIAAEYIPRAYTNNGIFFPIIANNGVIRGNWSPYKKTMEVSFFNEEIHIEGLSKEWERYRKYQMKKQ